MDIKTYITSGRATLGIELGSTRIKAVLIGEDYRPVASGGHSWENKLVDGVWTYSLDDVWNGIRDCYANLRADVETKYGVTLTTLASIGVSAMMHGYMAFDANDNLLVPFRTWRNTMTGEAAKELSELFGFNVPQRWSIAHIYQAVMNGEEHVPRISYLTTLAGYVHWKLTGRKVLGVGDASGMFPMENEGYHPRMAAQFDELLTQRGVALRFADIMPQPLSAGEDAGALTAEGAALLDPTGALQTGIPLCPPEGDAGTGMVATNSVAPRTGNVSAGTSIFAMVVLERPLSRIYPELDVVATPDGAPVAMVHCNNGMSDFDAWVGLFTQLLDTMGAAYTKPLLYDALYETAMSAAHDCGGLVSYNYLSGEHNTGFDEGRPLFARLSDADFSLANFMRTHLYSAIATLKLGMDILMKQERVTLDQLLGHGGLFKAERVGQAVMASALGVPVVTNELAGEGGAWGAALLAAYSTRSGGKPLGAFLDSEVFASQSGNRVEPDAEMAQGFSVYMERWTAGLAAERAAVETMRR